jgi:hypothetical protein
MPTLQVGDDNPRRYLEGGGWQGGKCPPQYFFNLGIIYLVTELNNGKYKNRQKKENEKLAFYGSNFPLFQI